MNIGDVIRGKYRLLRLLGDGGMGSVYEAQHELLGTRVAIKVLHSDLARRTGLVERFLQEARVAAQIKSPHVVQVTDVDRSPEGVAYIVMELLEGEPLSATMDRVGKLPLAQATELTRQMLLALEAAHALGVVHRDLKPENAFVTYPAGKPVLKLIDFGIAKLRNATTQAGRSLTVAGALMGTAEYMAPEQAHGADQADARSDIYAVGVMLYEMLAAKRPVAGEDARVIAIKVERGEIVPLVHAAPEVPREIAGLVHRAMAPSPAVRFQTATEMRLALESALAGRRTASVPGPPQAPGRHTVAARPATEILMGPAAMPMEPAPRTERAGPSPIAFGAAPALTGGTSVGAHAAPERRSGGARWALLAIPVVLAGGGALAYTLADGSASPTPTPAPSLTVPPSVDLTPTATATTPPPAPAGTPGGLEPLTPPGPHPGPSHPGEPGHPPHAPSAAPTETSSPPVFPTGLPSTFPIPLPTMGDGGLPFLPFPLPTGLPSTLPFPIPGLPGTSTAPASSASDPKGPKTI